MIEEKDIINMLRKQPLPSNKLIAKLFINKKISKNNIRVRLSRMHFKTVLLSKTTLQHNEHLYYLPTQGTQLLKVLLGMSIDLPNIRLLEAIKRQKFLFTHEYAKILGQFANIKKGHKAVKEYINELVEDQLIDIINAGKNDEYITFPESVRDDLNIYISNTELEERRLELIFQESIVADYIEKWKKSNFLSWNGSQVVPWQESATKNRLLFNGLFVDSWGFSYVTGIRQNKEKPKPVIIESVLYREICFTDIKGFSQTISNLKNVCKVETIPVFLYAKPMNKEIFNLAKRLGVILLSISENYDSEIISLIQGSFRENSKEISKLNKHIERMTGSNNNLKASLFNYVFALLLISMGFENYELNRIFSNKETSEKAECDIYVQVSKQLIIAFELKAYSRNKIRLGTDRNDPNTVKKFFEKTINVMNYNFSNCDIIPVFITLSDFETDAIEYMSETKKSEQRTKTLQEIQQLFPKKLFYNKQDLLNLESKYNDFLKDFKQTIKSI